MKRTMTVESFGKVLENSSLRMFTSNTESVSERQDITILKQENFGFLLFQICFVFVGTATQPSHSTTPHPMSRARRWYTVVRLLYDLCSGLAIFSFKLINQDCLPRRVSLHCWRNLPRECPGIERCIQEVSNSSSTTFNGRQSSMAQFCSQLRYMARGPNPNPTLKLN